MCTKTETQCSGPESFFIRQRHNVCAECPFRQDRQVTPEGREVAEKAFDQSTRGIYLCHEEKPAVCPGASNLMLHKRPVPRIWQERLAAGQIRPRPDLPALRGGSIELKAGAMPRALKSRPTHVDWRFYNKLNDLRWPSGDGDRGWLKGPLKYHRAFSSAVQWSEKLKKVRAFVERAYGRRDAVVQELIERFSTEWKATIEIEGEAWHFEPKQYRGSSGYYIDRFSVDELSSDPVERLVAIEYEPYLLKWKDADNRVGGVARLQGAILDRFEMAVQSEVQPLLREKGVRDLSPILIQVGDYTVLGDVQSGWFRITKIIYPDDLRLELK